MRDVKKYTIYKTAAVLQGTFTAATTDIITMTAHGYEVGDVLQFSTTDTLPAGLSTSTDYYVISVPSANTFKVSATQGGTTVDITDTGTGTHTATLKGRVIYCGDHRHLELDISTSNTSTFTVLPVGTNEDTVPDFLASASPTNYYKGLTILDHADYTNPIDYSTGIAVAGTDINKGYAVNIDGLKWFTLKLSTFTQGNLLATITLFND